MSYSESFHVVWMVCVVKVYVCTWDVVVKTYLFSSLVLISCCNEVLGYAGQPAH